MPTLSMNKYEENLSPDLPTLSVAEKAHAERDLQILSVCVELALSVTLSVMPSVSES